MELQNNVYFLDDKNFKLKIRLNSILKSERWNIKTFFLV